MDISPIQLAKQELRQQMLARKSQLTSLQVRGTSDCITHRIIQSFNRHYRAIVLAFVAIL